MKADLQSDKAEKQSPQVSGGLQRAAVDESPVNEVPPVVYEVLNSPGQPLDKETRAFFELRFGHDFSQVRVHTDAKAAESARIVNARAYTVGKHIAFAQHQYSPRLDNRRHLLAHELIHTIQQDAHPPDALTSQPHPAAEQEATVASQHVVSQDSSFSVAVRCPQSVLQTSAADDEEPLVRADIDAERAWTKQHPAGRVDSWSERNLWILSNFDVGSARLKPEHERGLSTIGKDWWPVKKNNLPGAKIHISGHASNTGLREKNVDIAARRAIAVKNFLGKGLVEDERMLVDSFSDTKPLVGGDDAESLAIERRVEVRIEEKGIGLEPPVMPPKTSGPKRELPPMKGVFDSVIPEEIRPEEHKKEVRGKQKELVRDEVIDIIDQVTEEATSGLGRAFGTAAALAALYFALKDIVEVMEFVNTAQHAGERLAAIKATSYTLVALARKESIPTVPLTDEWPHAETKEWNRTVNEVTRETNWKLTVFEDLRNRLKQSRAKALRSKEYERQMIEVGKVAGLLEAISKVDPEEALNAVYQAIGGEIQTEARLEWHRYR